MRSLTSAVTNLLSTAAPAKSTKCRRKFLRFFPKGFQDKKYFAWERGYKWAAHERWNTLLHKAEFQRLLAAGEFTGIGTRAMKSLAGTNLLFSFESMALRDALKTPTGAETFATGLFRFLHGRGTAENRFEEWAAVVETLPKKQSRVFTHPVTTVFGFIAQPEKHIFFKPNVTKRAAEAYGYDLTYRSRPSWEIYSSLLGFAEAIRTDLADLAPRDMIDIQSFIWVQGSDEYR